MDKVFVHCVIIISTWAVILWDVYLYLDKHPDNTISQVMIEQTKKRPWISLLWGILMGHWFF